jgi:hypothetical protein
MVDEKGRSSVASLASSRGALRNHTSKQQQHASQDLDHSMLKCDDNGEVALYKYIYVHTIVHHLVQNVIVIYITANFWVIILVFAQQIIVSLKVGLNIDVRTSIFH